MEITTLTSNKAFNYIAFFDLDRTITSAVSGKVLARRAFNKGLMNRSDLQTAVYLGLAYRLGFADPVKIMEKMVGWVKDLQEQVFTELCSEVSREIMLPSIHSEVIDELKMHKSKNARTIILSTSLTQICKEVADYLNMDDVICSKLESRNGYLTGRPEGNLCYGTEKLLRIKEYCERNNSTPAESWYYADAIVDLYALNFVGFPVCINPDAKLKKKAVQKGWPIRKWKNKKINNKELY